MQSQMQTIISKNQFQQQSNFQFLSQDLVISHKNHSFKRKKRQNQHKQQNIPKYKVFLNIPFKYIININDLCFINEFSLRNPDKSEETIFKSLCHFKIISKININDRFVNLYLKRNQDNYIPPEYFFKRLRSFGDKQMANIANHLQKINLEFSLIKNASNKQEVNMNQYNLLDSIQTFLESFKDRKLLIYISSIKSCAISLKNVIFSISLLNYLGIEVQSMIKDFIKNKCISFQIFSAKNYANFLQMCLQRFALLQQKIRMNPNMTQEEKHQITTFQCYQQIIRRKQGLEGDKYQLIKAKIRWFSPHPQICCIEILQQEQKNCIQFNNLINEEIQLQQINHSIEKLVINNLTSPQIQFQENKELRQNQIEQDHNMQIQQQK